LVGSLLSDTNAIVVRKRPDAKLVEVDERSRTPQDMGEIFESVVCLLISRLEFQIDPLPKTC
jgi:hypothetical protein